MNTKDCIARSAQVVLAAALVVGGLTGCAGSSKGSSPTGANLSTASLQPSRDGTSGGGGTGGATTGGTPTQTAIVEPPPTMSTQPAPPSSAPPTLSNVRASATQLCRTGTVTVFADVAGQHGITSVFLNMRFVPDGSSTEYDSRGSMTESRIRFGTYSTSVNGRNFIGTGTLHYTATATDSAGQSASSAASTIPVVNCP